MGRGPWRWRLSGKDDADEAAWLLRLAHATCLLARHDRDHDRDGRRLERRGGGLDIIIQNNDDDDDRERRRENLRNVGP